MKARLGILFVHGIVGNNRIFDFLFPLIPEGCPVRSVVLDGHGGNALDFSQASMEHWKKQVADAIAEMSARCDKVCAVGHSMGCLLLLEEAYKGNIKSLFLLNPPLKLRIKPRLFTNALKVALGMTDGDEVAKAAKEAYGVSMDYNLLHYYGWPMRYMELFAEIRRIRKLIAQGIRCQVFAMLSSRDEMVSTTSSDIIRKMVDAEVIILPESHHYHYSHKDSQTITSAFRKFLNVNVGQA